jgi:hypothetical protein
MLSAACQHAAWKHRFLSHRAHPVRYITQRGVCTAAVSDAIVKARSRAASQMNESIVNRSKALLAQSIVKMACRCMPHQSLEIVKTECKGSTFRWRKGLTTILQRTILNL